MKSLGNSAENRVDGEISNGADWYEECLLTDEDNDPLTGVAEDTWQFQFRKCEGEATDLVLSTTAGTLTVTEEAERTVLLINCPQTSLTNMCGDYIADLVSKDSSNSRLTHRAHGVVTFLKAPIAF